MRKPGMLAGALGAAGSIGAGPRCVCEGHRAARGKWSRAAVCVPLALGLFAAGCNTTEGVGRDIKSAGKGIEEAASDAKD